jgi:hypothetical protein
MDTLKAQRIRQRRQLAAQRRRERVGEALARGEVRSVSSNTKWAKVLPVLRDAAGPGSRVWLKVLDEDSPRDCPGLLRGLFEDEHIEFEGGVLEYRLIEWLAMPRDRPLQFPVLIDHEFDGTTVRVYGYRRS